MKVYSSSPKVVVIGAGIGGLTSAAALARNGLDVTVLEAHTYPGGCAGTFFHRGYRFDAGATLAGGFYPGGPMDMVADMVGIQDWSAHPSEPAVIVHMPDGTSIHRYADERRWDEYRHVFGPKAERFFIWQENTADALWDLALQLPPWPPHSPFQLIELAFIGSRWLAENPQRNANPRLLVDVFTPLSRRLNQLSEKLRLFIDAQLLISAQTTSRYASSLYAASALDLPRRGVVQLRGGMISISQKLVQAIRDHGGQVLFRKEVKRIVTKGSECVGVETCGREFYPAEYLIANLPVDNVNQMLGIDHDNLYPPAPSDGWGAFMVYMGVDGSSIPAEFPLHHQIIHSEPLGETNSVFLSISPDWDAARAPLNKRAITVSTHTDLRSWWELYQSQPEQYGARKEAYLEKIIRSVECVLPGIRGSMDLALPGTPITFQRYTRRSWGWVGGFPQTSLLRSHKPYLGGGIWLVGDSIFPGQSVPAVALGGLRVAGMILSEAHGRNKIFSGRRKIYRPVNITAKGSIAAALLPKRHF